MARSKPHRVRISKKGGSCPCIQDKEILEGEERLAGQEPRFADIYHPNDEFVDLESFSETSSFGFYIDPLEFNGNISSSIHPTHHQNQQQQQNVRLQEAQPPEIPPGVGDQFEEGTYLSGGNISSELAAPDSESFRPVSLENRKLNILSWLDNYGEARGYRLNGSANGTSLMPQTDEMISSRMDSVGSIDVDETYSGRSRQGLIVGPEALKQQLELMGKACSTLINFRNDLEPLNKMNKSVVNWRTVQQVLSTWANLMSTIWKRSREGNITRGELYGFSRLCENLEILTLSVCPLDISQFKNPVVRLNLGRMQDVFNLVLSWTGEIQTTSSIEDFNIDVSSWSECMKIISMIVNEQLKITTIAHAKNLFDDLKNFSLCPKYELVLFDDVVPSKTAASGPWMFFGKVELKHIESSNNNNNDVNGNKTEKGSQVSTSASASASDINGEISQQINVHPRENGLCIKFWGSLSRKYACIDYGAIFHIVCRACFETHKYYENLTQSLLKTTKYLTQPLIPPSYAKDFGKVSKTEQNIIMNTVFAQIIADQIMEPTITGMDEILRSFHLLIKYTVKSLSRFIRTIKCSCPTDNSIPSSNNQKNKRESNTQKSSIRLKSQQSSSSSFKELIVPLDTVSNTLFQTIRRFLSLGPMKSPSVTAMAEFPGNEKIQTAGIKINNTIDGNMSLLTTVNKCLESAINTLYEPPASKNLFTFQHGIQTIFAVSQLKSKPEFEKKAHLDGKMKSLVLFHLRNLKKSNKEAFSTFKRIVHMIDEQIIKAENNIDIVMKKATNLGIIDPARTSGVSFSHRHGKFILIRYSRNSYIRHQAKQLRHTNEIRRHTRKYNIEPDFEDNLSDNNCVDG